MTTDEVKDFLLKRAINAFSKEQYENLKQWLYSLSDYDFSQFLAETEYKAKSVNISLKELLKTEDEIRKHNSITPNNSAANCVKANLLTDEEVKEYSEKVEESRSSDIICLTSKEDEILVSLWTSEKDRSNLSIPSDLFFAGTIPLLNCKIIIKEIENEDVPVEYKVTVFPDYQEKIRNSTDNDLINVGVITIYNDIRNNPISKFIAPFFVVKGVDYIMGNKMGLVTKSGRVVLKDKIDISFSAQQFISMFVEFLSTWYSIQIALLHPLTKEILQKSSLEKREEIAKNKKPKQRKKVCYIKKHIIKAEDLEKALNPTSRKFTRHALVWYVIGHWRVYKNGQKVFVKPYWKGALREVNNLLTDDGREREILVDNKKGNNIND